MNLDDYLLNCHLAGLRSNIVPPDPRVYYLKEDSQYILSIGSLLFLKNLKRRSHNTRANTGLTRKSPITIECSLYCAKQRISEIVSIKLDNGFRDANIGSGARVKHRYTYWYKYHEANYQRKASCLSSASCSSASLCNNNSGYRKGGGVLRGDSGSFVDFFAGSLGGRKERVRRKRVTGKIIIRGGYLKVLKEVRDSGYVYKRFVNKGSGAAIKNSLPFIIVPLDVIVYFSNNADFHSDSDLILHCDLYVDGFYYSRARLNLDYDLISSFLSFSDTRIDEAEKHQQIIYDESNYQYSCCCNNKGHLICSLHYKRILIEVQRILSYLFVKYKSKKSDVGRHRHLLYFYIQILHYARSGDVTCCSCFNIPKMMLTFSFINRGASSRITEKESVSNAADSFYSSDDGLTKEPSYTDDCLSSDDTDYLPTPRNPPCRLNVSRIFETLRLFSVDAIRYIRVLRGSIDLFLSPGADFSCNASEGLTHLGEEDNGTCTSHPALPSPLTDGEDVFMNTMVLSLPFVLNWMYNEEDSYVKMDGLIICDKMMNLMMRFSDLLSLSGDRVLYIIEPDDFQLLCLLLYRPLYGIQLTENSLDLTDRNFIYRNITYRNINTIIWKYSNYLSRQTNTLPLFLRFLNLNDNRERSRLAEIINKWRRPDEFSLLELFSRDFRNKRTYLRNFFMEFSSIEFINKYMKQILFSVIDDYILYNWLMETCIRDSEAAIKLYWLLKTESERNVRDDDSITPTVPQAADFKEPFISYENLLTSSSYRVTSGCLREGGMMALTPTISSIKLQEGLRRVLSSICHDLVVDCPSSYMSKSRALLNIICRNFSTEDAVIPLDEIPLFTSPSTLLSAIYSRSCSVVKSKRYPLVMSGKLTNGKNLLFMYKYGEDLSQDQMCQQLVSVVNEILGRNGIKSYLLNYNIAVLSELDGCIEFIPNTTTVFDVLDKYKSINQFLEGVSESNLALCRKKLNFAYSLADYSVFTYLLGVGDRHYHNILLNTSGYVVHVDYSFILGDDPSPLIQPPFKLTKEFINTLGGLNSTLFVKFVERFSLTFRTLRNNANPLLQILYQSIEFKLKNLSRYNIDDVKHRLLLNLDEKQLNQTILKLIHKSAQSISPIILDTWHQISSTWK